MFGIGLPELLVILAVALIVVGPDKLPGLARSLAKGLFEIKKTLEDAKESLTKEAEPLDSVRKELQDSVAKLSHAARKAETEIWNRSADPTPKTDEEIAALRPAETAVESDAGGNPPKRQKVDNETEKTDVLLTSEAQGTWPASPEASARATGDPTATTSTTNEASLRTPAKPHA